MQSLAALYNGLPILHEADSRFKDRESLFGRIGPLLAKYDNQFGLCLVHVHCTLDEDERMVSRGNVSQPERGENSYPERWLATGEAYEFSSEPTYEPSPTLLAEFKEIVGDIGVLGLCYVGQGHDGTVLLETGVDRKNVTEPELIETAWLPADPMNPTTMACILMCDTSDTEREGRTQEPEPTFVRPAMGKTYLWVVNEVCD